MVNAYSGQGLSVGTPKTMTAICGYVTCLVDVTYRVEIESSVQGHDACPRGCRVYGNPTSA